MQAFDSSWLGDVAHRMSRRNGGVQWAIAIERPLPKRHVSPIRCNPLFDNLFEYSTDVGDVKQRTAHTVAFWNLVENIADLNHYAPVH